MSEEGTKRVIGAREGRRERMILQKIKETERYKRSETEIQGCHTNKSIIILLSGR